MSIDTDIGLIDNAESGETVRSAIIRVIEDLNQNGGNAQTLNGHDSDAFTKKSEFDNFVDNEVGQIHQVLDAINKGTTLKVIDLGVHEIGPAAGTLHITVPRSISDRSLLIVDDFYADIVSVAGGNGANANWTKSATYDPVSGIYSYTYGALATKITLHFYVKRASAIAVTDYDVHPLAEEIRSNDEYTAPAGEAWNYVKVNVPGSKSETTLNAVINNHTYEQPQQSTETWNKVIVNVPGPELQTGSVSVTENNYHNTFSPAQGKDGFSSFEVDVNVPFNTQSKSVEIDAIDFSERVVPDSGWAGLSEVRITSALQLEEKTVTQNGDVTPGSGYAGLSEVHVQVPQQSIESGKSVTYSSGGTYTVNPSSGFNAMDSVEVTVQTPRLQQSKSVTLSQSGTITPDPNFDAMEEVVVTVSGGGGGNCYICTQAEWDAMSMATKKSKGLTVIRDSDALTTGYWKDYTRVTIDILAEFYGNTSKTASVVRQPYNHLIYFQSKWKKGADADNGTISHTNISYDSMTTGTERISNSIITPLTNYMTAILHDVTVGDNASITLSNGYFGVTDNALAIGIPFNSEVEIIAEHFSVSEEQIVTAKAYDYILFMAGKWAYGQNSSNGTYAISAGTLEQAGEMIINIDGQDKPAIALYKNASGKIPSGTTITLGNRASGSQDSVVAIGINEITS